MRAAAPATAVLLLASALAGCASTGSADLFDRELPEKLRVAAVERVSDTRALWRLACDSREPMALRGPAVDRLLALEGDAFWIRCEKQGQQLADWAVLAHVCGRAAGRPQAERFAILSLGRIGLDKAPAERPERRVVDDQRLQQVVLGTAHAGDAEVQKAAWCALAQAWGSGAERLRALAGRIPAGSALEPVRVMAPALAELPQVEEELLMAARQRQRGSVVPPDWQPQAWGVAPRHLALRGRGADFGPGPADFAGAVERTHDSYASRAGAPGPADLAVCRLLHAAMQAEAAALFAHADRDLRDTTSELGGLFVWGDDGRPRYEPVAPLTRGRDTLYLPPERLFERLRDGLAHVHFHVQKHDNGHYAGPGRGDLQFAERNRVCAVVFTFVDPDTLNADAFFPGPVVVDLGCIKRP